MEEAQMPQALATVLSLLLTRTDEAIRQSDARIEATEAKVILHAQRTAGQEAVLMNSRRLLNRIRPA